MSDSLNITPIGWLRTGKALKFDARHQPDENAAETNVLEMAPGDKFRKALKDIEGFDRIWLLWWFHRNRTWRPEVLPPRGPSKRRGVFATRSPHRPNPLGLSAVELVAVEGRTLRLRGVDLLDGTPVLDLKPYVPYADAFPEEQRLSATSPLAIALVGARTGHTVWVDAPTGAWPCQVVAIDLAGVESEA